MSKEKVIKLVAIGDGAVGKTCMLMVYKDHKFPETYVPTVFENYRCKVNVGDYEVSVQMWDTAGQEDLENIRTLSYTNTDVFLVCFAINDRTSYDNIPTKWMDELKQYTQGAQTLMIVGTKMDMRETQPEQCLSYEDGKALAEQVGAFEYMECSAKQGKVKEVFDAAILKACQGGRKGGDDGGKCCEIQ